MPKLFDQTVLQQRLQHRTPHWAQHDFLYRQTADTLRDRLLDIKRDLPQVAEIGWKSPVFDADIQRLKRTQQFDHLHLASIVDGLLPLVPYTYDAVISHLVLHWADDPAVMLQQYLFALKPDGVFVGCVLGGESLHELRDVLAATELELSGGVSPRVSPMLQVQDLAGMMQHSGFALPVVDVERITVTYATLAALLADLRGLGQANALLQRRRQPVGKGFWQRANALYQERYADERGRLELTLDVIYLLGWSPDPSQPQPKRRGSATVHLGEVLKP